MTKQASLFMLWKILKRNIKKSYNIDLFDFEIHYIL